MMAPYRKLCVSLALCILPGLVIVSAAFFSAPRPTRATACPDPSDVIIVPHYHITVSETWMSGHVYSVIGDVVVDATGVLTIEGGAIVKFNKSTTQKLDVLGTLTLQSTDASPVRFTSLRDDDPDFGCDTNGDGAGTQPDKGDWDGIYLRPNSTLNGNGVLRYSAKGLTVWNSSSADMGPTISGWTFEKNTAGLTLELASSGDITSTIATNNFNQNTRGLYVDRSSSSVSGRAVPAVVSNYFTNQSQFPIYLHGTAYPVYSSNTFSGNTFNAIGLGGTFNVSGTMPLVNGDADTGGSDFPYVVYDNLTLAAGTTLTLPQGMVIKLWQASSTSKYYLDVLGTLVLEGTQAPSVIFTSFLDDDFGGDANGDGLTTQPAPGDWDAIHLESSGTNFVNALVRYSDTGVQVRNNTSSPLDPSITNSRFEKNKSSGIYLYALQAGAITSVVSGNVSLENNYGIWIRTQGSATILATISHNVFSNTTYGAYLYVGGTGSNLPTFSSNIFYSNTYGLGTGAVSSCPTAGGASRPDLVNNTFEQHGRYPIYLGGSAWPVYSGNTFSNSHYPAIALAGNFYSTGGTWPIIAGDNNQPFPYVVDADVTICGATTEVTLEVGSVVKFNAAKSLLSYGPLYMSGTPDKPTRFTSLYDDSVGGDTNADGGSKQPASKDWKAIYLSDSKQYPIYRWPLIGDISIQYSTFGLQIEDYKHDDTNNCSTISDSAFSHNEYGLVFLADLAANDNACPSVASSTFTDNRVGVGLGAWGDGNLLSVVTDSTFFSNTYAVHTEIRDWIAANSALSEYPAWPETDLDALLPAGERVNSLLSPNRAAATGVALPQIVNNVFEKSYFPLYLGGTAFPSFSGNLFINSTHLAIRLGGTFNNSRPSNNTFTLPKVDGHNNQILPYAITNDTTPCQTAGHCISTFWTVASGATVGVLPDTVFKLDQGRYVDVLGELDLQGISSAPVIFTSYRDDGLSGDTNADGNATLPARGNWDAVYLKSSGIRYDYAFDYAFVKYADKGISIWNGSTSNLFPVVANNRLYENNYGLSLYTKSTGSILDRQNPDSSITKLIQDNLFVNNGTHISVAAPASTGNVVASAENNCLLPATSYGIGNVSAKNVVTATQNWWGDATGPKHATNPGQGVAVSDNVLFTPWLTVAPDSCQTALNAIQGRVARSGDSPVMPDPLPGVIVVLNNTAVSVTNQSGYFAFNDLSAGKYVLQPFLSGYAFSPMTWTVNLPPNASGISFIGTPIVGQTYKIAGRVVDRQNNPVQGVTILGNSTTASAVGVTGPEGDYTMNQVLPGTWTLTPLLPGYRFLPEVHTVTVSSSDMAGYDFIRRNLDEVDVYLPLVLR